MFWHFGDIHYSVLWKQLTPWALTLWEWNHACDSSCLRVLLKFKTLNPGGGSSLSSWLCAHCANPINLAPGSKQRAPGACLPRHPPKKSPRPPLLSESLPQRQRSCSFPLICCFFASSLVWEEEEGCFFSSWRRTRWWRRREMGGETFFGKSFILVAWGKNRKKTTARLNLNQNTKKRSFRQKRSFRPKKMANTNVENPWI